MVDDFRESDVRFVARLLNIKYEDVDLSDYKDKRKSNREHQCLILDAMNFTPFDDDAKKWMQTQLENLVSKQMQPREIIYHLSALCHQKQIEIPTYHYFSENISTFYNQAENDLLNLIGRNITKKQITMLSALLDNNGTHPLIHQ